MVRQTVDIISPDAAPTLAAQFRQRVQRSPEAVAYRHFDADSCDWRDTSWRQMGDEVARWQAAMEAEGLEPGDRVAVMMRNCREWVMLDQAALGLGLVVVPLYNDDRGDNVAYILEQAGVKLLLIEGPEQWCKLEAVSADLVTVERIISVVPLNGTGEPRLHALHAWLPDAGGELRARESEPDALATIVYTSGTTGRPKGVMLSHRNIVSNCDMALQLFEVFPGDSFLSFLPLSHMLERTAGYYLAVMVGATVAFSRGIPELAEDLATLRPTILISVPRIYERVYARISAQLEEKKPIARKLFEATVSVGWARFEYLQGRGRWQPSFLLWPLLYRLVARKILQRLGGRLRIAVSGGAPLSKTIARTFIGLGVPIYQGYGLTETSPLVSANFPDNNLPFSIGPAVPGIEVRIGADDELQVRGPNVMLGYWQNEQATKEVIDADGWFHSGDKARLDEDGRLFITGRIKEIIVLATGEKVPPADMEMAIATDGLAEQVMVIGEGRSFLAALVVLDGERWLQLAADKGLESGDLRSEQAEAVVLERLSGALRAFPGYAQLRRVALLSEPWSVDNGLLTPTLKLKRARILEHHAADVERLYEGH